MTTPRLSVVVISYNMARELPRTLRSLSPPYQRDLDPDDVEIIVVDNGSTAPADQSTCRAACPGLRWHDFEGATASPVRAINAGLAMARADLIGVCIDGARMASPRLLATALDAARLHPCPAIGTLAFHLGPDRQSRSMAKGYNQQVEDAMLAAADWENDGYALFANAVFAGSSDDGWFVIPSETNAMFLRRAQWDALGGFDPGFEEPGGGLANLDTWARACALPDTQVVMLLGEATFHQVHGGICTNSPGSRWDRMHAEYVRLRGHDYARPTGTPLLVGRVPPTMLPSVVRWAATRIKP